MTDATSLLQQLGFGEYEAKAYIALLRQSLQNGYELAKASGIPRANIYNVLKKLEERHAIIRVEVSGGTRYVPVAPDELTQRLNHQFKHVLGAARDSLAGLAKTTEETYLWNIEGYATLIERARTLIDAAENNLVLAIWQPEAQQLVENIASADTRGASIITLCLQACPQECGGCHEKLYRFHVTEGKPARWLIVIRDDVEMLMGNIKEESTLGFLTHQPGFIKMADEYLRNSMALAGILSDVGHNLHGILSQQTLELLSAIGVKNNNWLEHLNELLNHTETP
jgi:HTH-type transcriptional regulator, sugar sensing transcriptional regulator